MSAVLARILDGLIPRQAEVAKKRGPASRLRRTGVLAGAGTG